MRHDAIYRLYPNVVTIDDGAGAFDAEGNKVQLNETELEKIAAEIDAEWLLKKNEAEQKLAALGLTVEDLKALTI